MTPSLSILGLGFYLPPAHPVRELAGRFGADVSQYRSWDNVCIARNDDHPSGMAARALQLALEASGVSPADLKLVISAGVSRDYLPSWSVAAEVMKLCLIPETSFGIDMTIGCLGSVPALEFALGWLALRGGGHAAIVAAERWSQTVDRSRMDQMGLWAHGDGAGAAVVGLDVAEGSLARFCGAGYSSLSSFNAHILIKYGGTRFPVAPAGESPNARELSKTPRREVRQNYLEGYGRALSSLRERFSFESHSLVCNQTAPQIVSMIAEIAGVAADRVVITGQSTGHLGAVDVLLGVQRLTEHGPIGAPVVMAGSTAYAFGAGLLLPPA